MRWTLVSLCLALGLVSQHSLVDASDCTFDANALSPPLNSDTLVALDEHPAGQASSATFHFTFLGSTVFGSPAGSVLGWCVDYTRSISTGGYFMDLYSSYGAQQSGAVDNEVNMPILTYIINNFKVGDTVAQCGGEVIEFADIQVAIWMFIDDVALGTVAPVIQNDITGVQYPHDQCIVDYIVDESTPHSNYEPDCNDSGELIAVVMVANGYPDGTTVAIQNQVIIAEVPVAGTAFCDCPNAAPSSAPTKKAVTPSPTKKVLTPSPTSTPVRIRVQNGNFELDNRRWLTTYGNPVRECGTGNAVSGDCAYLFTGSEVESSRIRNRANFVTGGKAGDIFTVIYFLKGKGVPRQQDFRALVKVFGSEPTKTLGCKSSRSGTFGYVDMRCTVEIDRAFETMYIVFDYRGARGSVYLDLVRLEYSSSNFTFV